MMCLFLQPISNSVAASSMLVMLLLSRLKVANRLLSISIAICNRFWSPLLKNSNLGLIPALQQTIETFSYLRADVCILNEQLLRNVSLSIRFFSGLHRLDCRPKDGRFLWLPLILTLIVILISFTKDHIVVESLVCLVLFKFFWLLDLLNSHLKVLHWITFK